MSFVSKSKEILSGLRVIKDVSISKIQQGLTSPLVNIGSASLNIKQELSSLRDKQYLPRV